ncbi:MAG: beta-ketoacyl-ACP synthase II [Bdellovibrionota bacterium]|nr:beta-ketoacyl-ACP synthase II [Bdellovibrionota bacterium]
MTNGKLNRVAITGMGAICGLGHSLPEIWKKIKDGESGISKVEHSYADKDLPINIAGEVKNFTINEELLSAKEAPRYDKFIHFALHSANEAYLNAGLDKSHNYLPEKMGCIIGVGMGGFPFMEKEHNNFKNKGHRRVSPFFIPSVIPNMASGLVSIRMNLRGVNFTVSSACASAGHALSTATTEIMAGRQDLIISGGAESVLCNLPYSGFNNMKALSKSIENPKTTSRPFDVDRNGFVMGEGAGILVLENLEKAKERGATIYAELIGFGNSSDAHHITAPHPEGIGASGCMQQALESAGIAPEKIDYINAHGTSTPLGDIAETKAIKKVFGEHAYTLKVSSTKSMTGHLLGAAGGVETIFSSLAIHEGILPPTINLNKQDPECDLDYVANKAKTMNVEYALNNSFGFGGTNSALVLKKFRD